MRPKEVRTLAQYHKAGEESCLEVGCLNHCVSLSLSQVVKPHLRTNTVQRHTGEVQERSHSVVEHLICRRLPEQLLRRLGANGSLVKLALPSHQMAS